VALAGVDALVGQDMAKVGIVGYIDAEVKVATKSEGLARRSTGVQQAVGTISIQARTQVQGKDEEQAYPQHQQHYSQANSVDQRQNINGRSLGRHLLEHFPSGITKVSGLILGYDGYTRPNAFLQVSNRPPHALRRHRRRAW